PSAIVFLRCTPDHHNLALIRGDRKNPSLQGPSLEEYRRLYEEVRRLWAPREVRRYGAVVEPMLQKAKMRTAAERRQVIPCRAGILNAVIYANGDVSFCETHPPIGNLRRQSFTEIWRSSEAERLRRSIAAKECYCTNEVFLWPSIVYQPPQLVRVLWASRHWLRPPAERAPAVPELRVLP
ncbi:MAG: SPASM domain-containing protein, partial [Bryobacteraceae bacterium]|nr:SPASM domain-containing protein [Bryobacteraceae bacterium]